MLDKIEAEIGRVEPEADYSNMTVKELTAKATDLAIKKARKCREARALIEYAMLRIYGRDEARITEILNTLSKY